MSFDDLPEIIRTFPSDLPISALWRQFSKPELAMGTYVRNRHQGADDLDTQLRERHDVGLLDLAYSEAYLPPAFRHVTDEHVEWAMDDSREHGSWVAALQP